MYAKAIERSGREMVLSLSPGPAVIEKAHIVFNDGFTCLTGETGAGKTTFIKLLCRLYDVTEGVIKIGGRNINEYSYEEYMRILAVVFQDFKLFGYTIDENIRMGDLESGNDDISDICDLSGISDWINKIENHGNTLLYKSYDDKGVEPSGGQAQKLAIARALYRDAPIVILDEPTAVLTPQEIEELMKIMKPIKMKKKKTKRKKMKIIL